MNYPRALDLAKSLVEFDSVSCRSNGPISDWVASWLQPRGFAIERLEYLDELGQTKVSLIAKREPLRGAKNTGGVCYLGHTDVVPADDWGLDFCSPFQPVVRDGRLYGRGSCDMKGSVACALAAVESIQPSQQTAPIYLILTADEEINMRGAKHVAIHSRTFREMVASNTIGIIGEPTQLQVIHQHKGGQTMWVTARGRSAHSSSRDGINANERLFPILPALLALKQRTEMEAAFQNQNFDPPTLSWNMVIRNEPFASNVTPSLAEVIIFLRAMPHVDHQPLVEAVANLAHANQLEFRCNDNSPPLDVDPTCEAVQGMLELTQLSQAGSVCYATDGCALRELKQLVVCGPGSIQQAHRNDEWIALEQLDRGTDLYRRAFERWACS